MTILLAGLALLALPLAPQTAPVQGTVRTEGSLESIPYATVEIPALRMRVATDVRGFFVISSVPEGTHQFVFSALGHRAVERTIEVGAASRGIEVRLPLQPVEVAALEVTTTGTLDRIDVPGPAPSRVEAELVRMTPAVAEPDIFRSIATLPAVQTASDFSSAFYVRGGSPDQNLITLDGAPLFNPYHLAGVFAAIDPDAVSSIDVFTGAMPARVGDRLSSGVQVWTREGGRDSVRTQGAISLVSARAGVDGPLPGGGGSYLVSVRRTYLDLFTSALAKLGVIEQGLPYHFIDAHLKLTHDVGEMGSLAGSFYVDTEKLTAEELFAEEEQDEFEDAFDWGSRVGSLSWRQPLGTAFLLETMAAFSSFRSDIDFFQGSSEAPGGPGGSPIQSMRGRVYMRDALAGASLTWYGGRHRLRAGVQVDDYQLDYDVSRAEDDFFAELFPQFTRDDGLTTTAAYLEDEIQIGERLGLRAGLRTLSTANETELLPRAGLDLRLTPQLGLSVGGGRYAQPLHSFRNEEALLASFIAYELLAPGLEGRLATAEDVVVGVEWSRGPTRIRVDGYKKWMHDLPVPPLPAEPIEAELLVVEGLLEGSAEAEGIELLATHDLGEGSSLMLSYALTRAEREISGERFTPRFERRHTLDLIGTMRAGESTLMSARFVLASGQPYTPVIGRFVPFGTHPVTGDLSDGFFTHFLLGQHNSARLPGYQRLDVSVRREMVKNWFGRRGTITPFLQVVNLLNAKNVLIADPTAYGPEGPQLDYIPQLPILPTFGVEWRF